MIKKIQKNKNNNIYKMNCFKIWKFKKIKKN